MSKGLYLALVFGALGLSVADAQAGSCHPAYDLALEKAKQTGSASIVKEVGQLPHVRVANIAGTVACEIVLPGDLPGGTAFFEDNQLDPVALGQLQRNEEALAVALDPRERDAFESMLRKIDFAGVHIGQTMQDAFETLHRQRYVSTASGHQIYNGIYRYDIECNDDDLRYGNGHYPSPPLRAKTCAIGGFFSGPGPFVKTDESGTRYEIEVYFTTLSDTDRAGALRNARVWKIDAKLKMKEEVGKDYYEKLATDRYGDVREGRMPQRLEGALTYAGYRSTLDDDTHFRIEPGSAGLSVEVQDKWLHDSAYEDAVEQSLARERKFAHDAPKPKF